MLDFLLERALEIARRVDARAVVVISDEEVRERVVDDIVIFAAPKSYTTLLESAMSTIEETSQDNLMARLAERYIMLTQAKDYISSMLYFKGIGLDGIAVSVISVESLKGIAVVDLSKSRIQKALLECTERVDSRVMKAVLSVALSIAQKGREGKPVGTAFVIGDVEEVLKRSRQLIPNPYQGHPESVRDIKDPTNWESVREFAQLDGVFILDEKGLIVAAGRYIEVSAKDLKLKQGLGGRHIACAAITRETNAISVVVSESGGDITVYKDGEEILEISGSIL
ncbi:MAG TPA: diadenylate cyclase [Archaeoglobus veneficus]|nr:MAG: diadenylate cyclase [Archaeoglobales archaeon]HDM60177.1 diadenylate cyclase [Archaeoglobus veneficus]